MSTTTEFKTISQVEAETETRRYYRTYDYARALALTAFLRELEAEHGENFRLVTAHPLLICNRGIKDKDEMEASAVFVIGLWARWNIGNTGYYLQMNENPFFDAYITRHWRLDRDREQSEYGSRMNDMMYGNSDWSAEPKNIALLIKCLRQSFVHANKRTPDTYIKEIPAYDRKNVQTIYKGA